VWTNDVFLRVCGYRLEELRGQNPGQLLQGPESDPAVVQVLHEAVQATRPCQCELVNYRKNGEPYRVHISLGPIFRDGTHRGFLSIERDLSVGPGDRLAA
jgi:PAS domain S-box-containing protein